MFESLFNYMKAVAPQFSQVFYPIFEKFCHFMQIFYENIFFLEISTFFSEKILKIVFLG